MGSSDFMIKHKILFRHTIINKRITQHIRINITKKKYEIFHASGSFQNIFVNFNFSLYLRSIFKVLSPIQYDT